MKISFLLVTILPSLFTAALAKNLPTDGEEDKNPSGTQPDTNRYIVQVKNAEGTRIAKGTASKVHVNLDKIGAIAASLPNKAAAQALARNPNILSVEIDPPRYLQHNLLRGDGEGSPKHRKLTQSIPYGYTMVQADELAYNTTNQQTVCIIDSGYDLGHEDLPSATADQVNGYDGNLLWDRDGFGHGTHVAGTIAAKDNDLGVIGVAPGVNLYIVRVFGDDGSWSYASDLIDAAYRCVDGGAHIVSMSLGCSGGGCRSNAEQAAFQDLHDNSDILSIAAAGNAGNTKQSYPASYDSVVSVAALDSNKAIASFSQRNNQVELAAPGVLVRSTVPSSRGGTEGTVTVGGTSYLGLPLDGTVVGDVTGSLTDCGLGTSLCSDAKGKVCLISRGEISFADKVGNCEASEGIATVIYNNVPGDFSGTLGGASTAPAIGISQEVGFALNSTAVGKDTQVLVEPSNYEYWDGTSMATPHVSGVVALVWSHHPQCTNAQIRKALADTAEDLGDSGRDRTFGYGLVQAFDAKMYLDEFGCNGDNSGGGVSGGGDCSDLGVGEPCGGDSDCCSGKCKGQPGSMTCK